MLTNNSNSTQFITPNRGRYDGHFTYQIDNSNFSLGYIQMSKPEALVRLGIMPHSNSLMNKVINTLGNRVLSILRQTSENADRPQQADHLITQTEADDAELLYSWAVIDILSIIKPLEQLTGLTLNSVEERSTIINDVQCKLTQKYNELTERSIDEEDVFQTTLNKKLITLFNNLKNKIQNSCPNKNASARDHQIFQRGLLRSIMTDFELLQATISTKQRTINSIFSIANATNTETTQKAYYEIQNHIYSAQGITRAQLWMTEQASTTLNTADHPDIHQEDALFAACLLESLTQNSLTTTDLVNAKTNFETEKNKIKEQHTALKLKIDAERKSWLGRKGLWRDSSVSAALDNPLKNKGGFWSWWDTLTTSKDENQNQAIKEIIETDLASQEYNSLTTAFKATNPAYIYKSGDLFSAIATLGYEFGEYFTREMGSKHPVVSTVGFTLPSAYLTSVALASMNVAPHVMTSIYTNLSQLLSGYGHLTNPQTLTNAVKTADHGWLWVTKCHGIAESTILNAFGGPKLTFLATEQANKIISGIPETTIDSIIKMFDTGTIDTALTRDAIRERLKTYLKTTIMLAAASGLGVGIAALPHSIPGAHAVKKIVGTLDNVQESTFAALAHGHGLMEAGYLAQLTAEAKTAGLFLAKIIGINHFLRDGHEAQDRAALEYFSQLHTTYLEDKDNFEVQEGKHYKKFISARETLEEIILTKPEVKSLFDINFLNKTGVKQLSKPPLLIRGITSAIKVIGSTILLLAQTPIAIPYFLYREFIRRPIENFYYTFLYINKSADTIPDNAALRYFYKNGAKLLLGAGKLALGTGYGAKFLLQSIFGFTGRILSGISEGLQTVINAPLEFLDRWKQVNLTNAIKHVVTKQVIIKFLGGITSPIAEFAGKAIIIATSPILAIGAAVSSVISYANKHNQTGFFDQVKTTFGTVFKSPWKKLSGLKNTIKNNLIKLEHNDPYMEKNSLFKNAKQWLTKNTPSIANTTLIIKNTLGHAAAFVREYSIRALEYRLQAVAMKNEKDKKIDLPTIETLYMDDQFSFTSSGSTSTCYSNTTTPIEEKQNTSNGEYEITLSNNNSPREPQHIFNDSVTRKLELEEHNNEFNQFNENDESMDGDLVTPRESQARTKSILPKTAPIKLYNLPLLYLPTDDTENLTMIMRVIHKNRKKLKSDHQKQWEEKFSNESSETPNFEAKTFNKEQVKLLEQLLKKYKFPHPNQEEINALTNTLALCLQAADKKSNICISSNRNALFSNRSNANHAATASDKPNENPTISYQDLIGM